MTKIILCKMRLNPGDTRLNIEKLECYDLFDVQFSLTWLTSAIHNNVIHKAGVQHSAGGLKRFSGIVPGKVMEHQETMRPAALWIVLQRHWPHSFLTLSGTIPLLHWKCPIGCEWEPPAWIVSTDRSMWQQAIRRLCESRCKSHLS